MTGFLDWLDDLPTLVLFLIFVAVGLAVALLCAWVVDRHFQEDVRSRTGPAVATVVGAVATIYAILIAFVIVNEWQSYQDAQPHVSQESAALARRSRLNAATSRLPNELFVLIALMSLALVVVAGALDTRHRLSHCVLVGGLTIVVALNLALSSASTVRSREASRSAPRPCAKACSRAQRTTNDWDATSSRS